ncbi:hypothetical protein PG616_01190 [Riemerella anatipestifer]|nr:hypothetical protein [Riemerella anatipestifer]
MKLENFLLVVLVVNILDLIYYLFRKKYKILDNKILSLVSFLIKVSSVAIIVFIAIYLFGKETYKKEMYTPIASLNKDKEVDGAFVLEYGGVNEKYQYFMYKEVGKDTYKQFHVATEDYLVKKCDNKKPGIYFFKIKKKLLIFSLQYIEEQGVIIVPKNTIIKKHNL